MWNVTVRVPRSAEPDVVKYNILLNGVFVDMVTQPVSGDASYSYQIAGDGTYSLSATAVDASGNESPQSDPLVAILDHVNPMAPAKLVLVAATWVP
jgi:hypothetical protein